MTADLVGEYLFTDTDFINNLSTNNRNVFQKIYDEVKYLCKVVTAGSKEARELEKVKRAFEKAYKADSTAQTDTKYSITEAFTDSNGTHFDNAVLLDTDFFDGISPRNWGAKLRKAVEERASTDPFILPIVDESGETVVLQFANPKERVSKNGGAKHKVLGDLTETSDNISKLAVIHVDEIVSVSEENSPYYTSENSHGWFDKNGWLHRNANVINSKNGNIYNLTIDIAKTADGRTVLYATDGKIKKVGNAEVNSLKIKGSGQDSNFDNKVTQGRANVNTQYSLNELTDDGLTMTYVRVPNQNTQNYGSTYGQNIESAGEYMSMDTMEGKNKINGYEYGTIQFKKPLVLEHINTSDTGWKKTVSDMYNGLTGKKLTKALIKDGYDAIVTYDKYGYREIVNLNGKKLNDQNGNVNQI